MPTTVTEKPKRPIIGGVFTDPEDAQKAYNELTGEQDYHPENIQMYVAPKSDQQAHDYRAELVSRGVSASQAKNHVDALEDNRVLLVAYNVTDKADVINTLNKYGATYDPDGSRNMRLDVASMTTGALVGVAAGTAAGAAVAGPLGAVAGAVGGEALGVAAGAAAGKKAEENR